MVIWNCRGRAIIFLLESAREPAAAPGRFCFAWEKGPPPRRARFPHAAPALRRRRWQRWYRGGSPSPLSRAPRIIKRLLRRDDAERREGRGPHRRTRRRRRRHRCRRRRRLPPPCTRTRTRRPLARGVGGGGEGDAGAFVVAAPRGGHVSGIYANARRRTTCPSAAAAARSSSSPAARAHIQNSPRPGAAAEHGRTRRGASHARSHGGDRTRKQGRRTGEGYF